MADNLSINAGSKEEKYRELLPQLYALISTETDFIANLANLSAALKQTFNFFWVGFYLVKGDELVLGPFQGPIACTRIRFGRGVCGTAWKEAIGRFLVCFSVFLIFLVVIVFILGSSCRCKHEAHHQ